MKKLILKSSSLLILTFILSLTLLLFVPIEQSYAQKKREPIKFTPQVAIPGGIEGETLVGSRGKTTLLSQYIAGVYYYSFAVAGILAAIVLMGGGLLWLVSGGSQTKVSQAKDIIGGSIIGLGILFSAYLLLNTINPALLENKALEIEDIGAAPSSSGDLGCCSCEFYVEGSPDHTYPMCESSVGITAEQCNTICTEEAQNRKTVITKAPKFIKTYEPRGTCNEEKICEKTPDNKQYLIYSDIFNRSGWKFDPEIDKQIPHISPDLASFLNCMRAKLPDGVGKISSISDSNIVNKNVSMEDCNQYNCPVMLCVHSCGSCHYGGGITGANESYAVDLGDEANVGHFKNAASICDSGAKVLNEDSHIHISVSKCPKY